MKTFEEWWKESENRESEPSPAIEPIIKNIKKLCKKAFEAGQEYEKEKIKPVEIHGIKFPKSSNLDSSTLK